MLIVLPTWLDKYIFQTLEARFEPQKRNLVVLDWDEPEIRSYLGTYFPRSFAEAYGIFSTFFRKYKGEYANITELSIYDFGCGTGGELIGFIVAVSEHLPSVGEITVRALDGNKYALRFLGNILDETSKVTNIVISHNLSHIVIDDFYDMNLVNQVITKKFDFIITFKAICEFVTRQQFEEKNPYKHFIEVFLPKLKENGKLCIADVTTYSDVSNEWLPKMLDKASMTSDVILVEKNDGYNEEYYVSHSVRENDKSKIAWRIYKKDKI